MTELSINERYNRIPLARHQAWLSEEAATMGQLAEDTHFDPFDRMLIWQAIRRDMILVSNDPEFQKFETEGLRLLRK